jgi:hypothetical protein
MTVERWLNEGVHGVMYIMHATPYAVYAATHTREQWHTRMCGEAYRSMVVLDNGTIIY